MAARFFQCVGIDTNALFGPKNAPKIVTDSTTDEETQYQPLAAVRQAARALKERSRWLYSIKIEFVLLFPGRNTAALTAEADRLCCRRIPLPWRMSTGPSSCRKHYRRHAASSPSWARAFLSP